MFKVNIIIEATQETIDVIDGTARGPFSTYDEAENYAIDRVSCDPELTYDIEEVKHEANLHR